jgi:hypothetical protein
MLRSIRDYLFCRTRPVFRQPALPASQQGALVAPRRKEYAPEFNMVADAILIVIPVQRTNAAMIAEKC